MTTQEPDGTATPVAYLPETLTPDELPGVLAAMHACAGI